MPLESRALSSGAERFEEAVLSPEQMERSVQADQTLQQNLYTGRETEVQQRERQLKQAEKVLKTYQDLWDNQSNTAPSPGLNMLREKLHATETKISEIEEANRRARVSRDYLWKHGTGDESRDAQKNVELSTRGLMDLYTDKFQTESAIREEEQRLHEETQTLKYTLQEAEKAVAYERLNVESAKDRYRRLRKG